jgi:hypothetical protein
MFDRHPFGLTGALVRVVEHEHAERVVLRTRGASKFVR